PRARSDLALRIGRRRAPAPDTHRVPAAGAAARKPRRGGAASRPRPRWLAARSIRPREHPRCLRRQAAPETAGVPGRARHRHRPRRRLPDRMSKLAIRHRLLLVVVAAVAAALAALIVGFNLLLSHNLRSDADRLLPARASGEPALLAV